MRSKYIYKLILLQSALQPFKSSIATASKPFTHKAMDCKRADGLNMGYDPYSPEMGAKYGAPGQTDDEGFNPYADTVGPGIYGGRVKRDANGEIVIGKQYQVSIIITSLVSV